MLPDSRSTSRFQSETPPAGGTDAAPPTPTPDTGTGGTVDAAPPATDATPDGQAPTSDAGLPDAALLPDL